MRGRKKDLSVEEQLQKIISDIESTETLLKGLKNKKKTLEEQIKADKLKEIEKIIDKSGLTIDEVKERLTINE